MEEVPVVEEAPAVEEAPVADVVYNKQGMPIEPSHEEAPQAEEKVEAEAVSTYEKTSGTKAKGFIARELAAKKAGGKVGKILLSCLLSLLIFVSAITVFAIVDIREGTDDDKVEGFIEGIDLKRTTVFELTGNKTERLGDREYNLEDMNIYEYIGEYLTYYYSDEFEVSPEVAERIVVQSGIQKYIAESLADCAEGLFEGEPGTGLEMDEIRRRLKNEIETLADGVEIPVNEFEDTEYYNEYRNWITTGAEDYINSIEGGDISVAELKRNNNGIYYLITIGLSYYTVAGLLCMILLLGYLLFVANKKSLVGTLKIFGITILSAAVSFAVLMLVVLFGKGLMTSICGSVIAAEAATEVLTSGVGAVVIALGIGVVLTVVGFVLGKIVKKKAAASAEVTIQ